MESPFLDETSIGLLRGVCGESMWASGLGMGFMCCILYGKQVSNTLTQRSIEMMQEETGKRIRCAIRRSKDGWGGLIYMPFNRRGELEVIIRVIALAVIDNVVSWRGRS